MRDYKTSITQDVSWIAGFESQFFLQLAPVSSDISALLTSFDGALDAALQISLPRDAGVIQVNNCLGECGGVLLEDWSMRIQGEIANLKGNVLVKASEEAIVCGVQKNRLGGRRAEEAIGDHIN